MFTASTFFTVSSIYDFTICTNIKRFYKESSVIGLFLILINQGYGYQQRAENLIQAVSANHMHAGKKKLEVQGLCKKQILQKKMCCLKLFVI